MPKSKNLHRILLKVSGEALLGDQTMGISPKACRALVATAKYLVEQGHELGIVIGGGNIYRGAHLEEAGIPRNAADQMGMLATIMNGLALQHAFHHVSLPVRLLSALECPRVAETYTWRNAHHGLSQKEVVLFVGGTGNPYFTTDTAAALRASETSADLLLKATKVPGVFDKDPMKDPTAKKYDVISYAQVLAENLQIMDATAIALCQSQEIPIFVCLWERLADTPLDILLEDTRHGTWVADTYTEKE